MMPLYVDILINRNALMYIHSIIYYEIVNSSTTSTVLVRILITDEYLNYINSYKSNTV